MSDDMAIATSGLAKSYRDVRVLDGVDLNISRGSVFALLGPNGAGKTTAVRILATLTEADAGRARVAGFDVRRERSAVRRRISLTGQFAALDDAQTGEENLRMMGRLARLSRAGARQRATELIQRFDLTAAARRRVGTYSGGMRRRLDLAACLLVPRPVVFLDEPTTGLDPVSRAAVWEEVRRLVDDGAAVLLTTQYLEEADRLSDSISVLSAGRVVAEGTPAELKDRVGGRRVRAALARADALDLAAGALRDAGFDGVTVDRRARTVGASAPTGADDLGRALDALAGEGIEVDEADLHRPTLDDAFFSLAGLTPPGDAGAEADDDALLEARS